MNEIIIGIVIALLGSQHGNLAEEIPREFFDWGIETNPDTKSSEIFDSDYNGKNLARM